jgi:hypothetical protein
MDESACGRRLSVRESRPNAAAVRSLIVMADDGRRAGIALRRVIAVFEPNAVQSRVARF